MPELTFDRIDAFLAGVQPDTETAEVPFDASVEFMAITMTIHEGSRALQMFSDPRFDELDEAAMLRALNNTTIVYCEPNITPRSLHTMFRNALAEQGYTYAAEANADAKTSPVMATFDELTTGDRAYFCLYVALVNACRNNPADYGDDIRCGEDMDETITAAVAHTVNKLWCALNDDRSQPEWADAPDWQKSSAISGVRFHRANRNAPPSASHDNWMAEKVAAGWVYGEAKDPEAKTHPCIVPYDQLPAAQRRKDALFIAVVHAMSAA